jgi:hypothetical protein
MVVWVLVAVSGLWWIASERVLASGPGRCERELVDQSAYGSHTVFGTATWTWIPPGRICNYDDGVTTSPNIGRAVLASLILALPPVTVVLAAQQTARAFRVSRLTTARA